MKRRRRSWAVIDLSCLATLPTQPGPALGFGVSIGEGGGEGEGEVSKNKMLPLNHLPGSGVRAVMGSALIIWKVTAFQNPPPPPSSYC